MIKAIETVYKGVTFRSRLEARWGIFMDALGIQWKYEPEKIRLATGRNYIPDFYLPSVLLGPKRYTDSSTWLEVKPDLNFVQWEKQYYFAQTKAAGVRPNYYVGTQDFQFFHVRTRTDGELFFLERFIMRTKIGDVSLHSKARTYGSPVDISQAIIAARSARF